MAKYYQKRSFNHEREASAIIASLREHGEAVGPGVCIDTVRHHWHVRYGGEVEPVCTGGGPAERYTLGRPSWL